MKKEIKIDELESFIALLFQSLKSDGIKSIVLDEDYYWEISTDELYSTSEKPKTFSLGQLYDDLHELENLKSEEKDFLWTDAKKIASLLRYISQTNPYISPK